MTSSRERVGEAVGRVLAGLQERREALGLAGLPEPEAQVRMRALDRLTVDQYQHLLALDAGQREGMIAALVAAQRRTHELASVAVISLSSADGRWLHRWFCGCGEESSGDFLTAEEARSHWRRHAGIPEPSRSAGRPAGAPRARPTLEPTE